MIDVFVIIFLGLLPRCGIIMTRGNADPGWIKKKTVGEVSGNGLKSVG